MDVDVDTQRGHGRLSPMCVAKVFGGRRWCCLPTCESVRLEEQMYCLWKFAAIGVRFLGSVSGRGFRCLVSYMMLVSVQ